MTGLNDYSGPFKPDLELKDFSREALVNLVNLYSRLYVVLDGFWYLTVKERINNREALACDIGAWDKHCPYEMSRISRAMNIQGHDVSTLARTLQLVPWIRQTKFQIEMPAKNQAILTITHCPTLSALEKEGEGRESEICRIVEPRGFAEYAAYFNRDIKVTCRKCPPRSAKDEVCCRWEFSQPSV